DAAALASTKSQRVDIALVLESFATSDRADDLDRLSRTPHRSVEAHTVPALHHLWPARADAQNEAPSRQRLERHRGHRKHRGRARAELRDSGRETDRRSRRGQVTQRRERVERPEL